MLTSSAFSQDENKEKDKDAYKSTTFNGLKFRLIGPAVTSGK